MCLKTLQKILDSCPNDTKVLFNLALTEYAASSFQKTDVFKAQIQKIAERVSHASCNDDEQNAILDYFWFSSIVHWII